MKCETYVYMNRDMTKSARDALALVRRPLSIYIYTYTYMYEKGPLQCVAVRCSALHCVVAEKYTLLF